jgi:hypothetical protein
MIFNNVTMDPQAATERLLARSNKWKNPFKSVDKKIKKEGGKLLDKA